MSSDLYVLDVSPEESEPEWAEWVRERVILVAKRARAAGALQRDRGFTAEAERILRSVLVLHLTPLRLRVSNFVPLIAYTGKPGDAGAKTRQRVLKHLEGLVELPPNYTRARVIEVRAGPTLRRAARDHGWKLEGSDGRFLALGLLSALSGPSVRKHLSKAERIILSDVDSAVASREREPPRDIVNEALAASKPAGRVSRKRLTYGSGKDRARLLALLINRIALRP